MKRVSLHPKAGQGTLEYILLTTLVVGIMLTIFNGPLRKFLSSFKARKTEYTNVVEQRNLGIPIRWFGGNFPDPGGGVNAGGTTEGGATEGGDNAGPDGPGVVEGPGNIQNPTPGGGEGGDTQGGNPPGGVAGPGAGGPGSNNSLLGQGSNTRTASNNRRGGRTTSGEGDLEGEEFGTGGTTGGARVGVGERAEGGTSDQAPENETEEQKEARLKAAESGETLGRERELFGNTQRKVRQGSCGDLDLKVILQIAFVIGLFFLLASMLFQKRGGKD